MSEQKPLITQNDLVDEGEDNPCVEEPSRNSLKQGCQ